MPDRIRRALPSLLAIVLLGFASSWFAERWELALGAGERPAIAWGWLGLAFLLLVLNAASALVLWRLLLRAVGHALPWPTAADSFIPTLLARYVPGKIWANAARLALAKRAGVHLGASTGAILWESLVALTAAGFVAVAGLYWNADPAFVRAAALIVVATIGLWLLTALLARSAQGAALMGRLGGTGPAKDPARMVAPLAAAVAGWLLFAAAHLAIARAIAPVGLPEFRLMAGAVALAWTAGYLAFVMPVGLGVRDGLLLALLATILTPAQALLFVAVARLVQLAVDATITLGWLTARAYRLRGTPSSPPSA
jgi:uncharacterized membrane protein YbhN (UPF0104 family)